MTPTLQTLHARGFDESRQIGRRTAAGRRYHVACSQCAALVISGTACHERGCMNETHECKGCNARIQMCDRYCVDCHPGRLYADEGGHF